MFGSDSVYKNSQVYLSGVVAKAGQGQLAPAQLLRPQRKDHPTAPQRKEGRQLLREGVLRS